MQNPSIELIPISTTPTLVFEGCGKVQMNVVGAISGSERFGVTDSFNPGTAADYLITPSSGYFEFKADAKVYCAIQGSGTATLKVQRWF